MDSIYLRKGTFNRKMNIIYISNLFAPYLTLDLQIKICKIYCEKNNIDNYVIIENDIKQLLTNLKTYSNIVIFTFACLGNDSTEVYMNIMKIMEQNVQLFSVFDPIILDEDIHKATNKFLLNAAIGLSLYQNEKWNNLNLSEIV